MTTLITSCKLLFFIQCALKINAIPNNTPSTFIPNQSNLPQYSNANTGGNDWGADFHQGREGVQSFEERTAAWRQYQQNLQRSQTPLQEASSTDDQGRLKLIATVSKGSISFFFFILMWRSIHHFEMADMSFRGFTRLLFVTPAVALFLGNLMGCVAAISPPNHKTKKRLKLILNANKTVEMLLFIYQVFRLTIAPSKRVIREVYVGRTLSNFVFLLQCQLFTKVTWDGLKTTEYYESDPSVYQAPIYDDYNPHGLYDGYENYGYENNEHQNEQSYF